MNRRALLRSAPSGSVWGEPSPRIPGSGSWYAKPPKVISADRLYVLDRTLFAREEMASDGIRAHARTVAEQVAASLQTA